MGKDVGARRRGMAAAVTYGSHTMHSAAVSCVLARIGRLGAPGFGGSCIINKHIRRLSHSMAKKKFMTTSVAAAGASHMTDVGSALKATIIPLHIMQT